MNIIQASDFFEKYLSVEKFFTNEVIIYLIEKKDNSS